MAARLTRQGVSKRYSETLANDAISLEVMPGEFVAVIGERGDGTSTRMKIVYGVVRPDAGRVARGAFPRLQHVHSSMLL